MQRTTTHRLAINADTKLSDLKEFLEKAGPNARLRSKNGELYYRIERKGSSVSHAAEHLLGTTTDKREEVMALIKQVFRDNHVDLASHIKTVLLPHEAKRLTAAAGDLKAKHLLQVFTGTVKIDGEDYQYERLDPFAKGSYGQIYKATRTSGDSQFALKMPLGTLTEAEQKTWRKETDRHLTARKAQLAPLNYVVETAASVLGRDGGIYQPMGLALCSGKELIGLFPVPAKEDGVDDLVALTVRDWTMGLLQIGSIGMAHRDIKPENWLLSKKGVWQLSDFGTAGDSQTEYQALGGKKGSHKVTGNGGVFAKAPEWLSSELPHVDGQYRVGHEADVFALGVAVFRLITNGSLPFNNPWEPSTTEIDYEATVLEYAKSGQSFCEWYSEKCGQNIPLPWQEFMDGALCANPSQRAKVGQLLELPVMMNVQQLDESELRSRLVQMASSGQNAH